METTSNIPQNSVDVVDQSYHEGKMIWRIKDIFLFALFIRKNYVDLGDGMCIAVAQ